MFNSKILTLILILSSPLSFSSTRHYLENSTHLKTSINKVIVHKGLVEIFKTAEVILPVSNNKKQSWIQIGPLDSQIDKNSIKISLGHKEIVPEQIILEEFYDYTNRPEEITEKFKKLKFLYAEKLDLLQKNKNLQRKYTFIKTIDFSPQVDVKNINYKKFSASSKNLNLILSDIKQSKESLYSQILSTQQALGKLQTKIQHYQKMLKNHTQTSQMKWLPFAFILLPHNKLDRIKKINISYISKGANWSPIYDIRIDLTQNSTQAQIKLVTSALVTQQTNESWQDIDLAVSTITPVSLFPRSLPKWELKEVREELMAEEESIESDKSFAMIDSIAEFKDVAPSVRPQRKNERFRSKAKVSKIKRSKKEMRKKINRIDYDKRDQARANGVIAYTPALASSLPAKSPMINDRYPLKTLNDLFPYLNNIQSLSAKRSKQRQSRAFSNSFSSPTSSTANQRMQFEISSPFKVNIKSHANAKKIPLSSQILKAELEYLTIPKKLKKVFIRANIVNTTRSPLANGAANIFVNGDLLSKSNLSNIPIDSFFSFPVGEDQNIEVKRLVTKASKDEGIISKTHFTEVKVTIEMANHHNYMIPITVKDLYPLTSHEDLEIKLLSSPLKPSSNYKGILTWSKVQIPAKGSKIITFTYSVEHPQDWIVSEFN